MWWHHSDILRLAEMSMSITSAACLKAYAVMIE